MARAVSTAGIGLDQSASGNLAFVGCEGGEDFFLLASRHFDEVQRAAEFRSDLVEFLWGDSEDSRRAGFFADFPTIGLFTTASLK
jgi:hypothetical protein